MNFFKDLSKDARNYKAGAVTLSRRNVTSLEGVIILVLDTNEMRLHITEVVSKCIEFGYPVSRPEVAVRLDLLCMAGIITYEPRGVIQLVKQETNYRHPNDSEKIINRAVDAQYYATLPYLVYKALTTKVGEVNTKELVALVNAKGEVGTYRGIRRYANQLQECGAFAVVKLSGTQSRYKRVKGIAAIAKQERL